MSDIDRIEQKLDAILAKLAPASLAAPLPQHHRELAAFEIDLSTMDNQHIQADGSTWTIDNAGRPAGMIYGYISKEKDPAQWGMMVAAVGSEERLLELLGPEPLTRYKVKPADFLKGAMGGEPLHRLSYVLSNPLPAMPPTA